MNILIDTTNEGWGQDLVSEIEKHNKVDNNHPIEFEYLNVSNLNISHCLGCNFCWLKTPGECVIQDDYEPILKKISKADQVWLISDLSLGFVSYKTKNLVDRVMPLVTMNLHFVGKQMRHVLRYDHNPRWGLVYRGEGDQGFLTQWCHRVGINFGTDSLGVFESEKIQEVIPCMF